MSLFKALARYRSASDVALVYFGYIFKFISPLLLYPLLTRRLGVSDFGVYAALYSFATVLAVVVEYGYALTGTRDMAQASPEERSRICSTILVSKVFLVPVCVLAGVGLASLNPMVRDHPQLTMLAVLIACAQGMSALWYFQGVKRVFLGVVIDVGGQLIALLASFWLVQGAGDLWIALSLQFSGFAISALIGNALMLGIEGFERVTREQVAGSLRAGFSVFLSRAAVMGYTSISSFVVIGVSSAYQAALYSASERVVSAATAPLRPLSSLVLPKMSSLAVKGEWGVIAMAKRTLLFTVLFYVGVVVLISISAPFVMPLAFGVGMDGAVLVLQTLSITLPLIAANTILGSQVIVSLRMDNILAKSVILGAVVNITTAFIFVKNFGAVGMVVSRIISEAVVLLVYLYALRRQLFGWGTPAPRGAA